MIIKNLIILLGIFFCSNANAIDSLSRKDIIEDLEYLNHILTNSHPNLFTYSSPEEVEHYFDEIKKIIPDSVSKEFAFELIAGASQVVKDGHTIFLPSTYSVESNFLHDDFLPFDIYWDGEQMIVRENFSMDTSILAGTVIAKIDGLAVEEVVRRITNVLPRDGDNLSYPNWILNSYFSSYYNFVFGDVKIVELLIDNKGYAVRGLSKDQINEIKDKRVLNNEGQKPLTLNIDTNLSTATIKISDFHSSVIRLHNQNFKKLMATYFLKIIESNVQHLILDLRDNQGGSLKNGRILLSYLMQEKFKLVDQYYRVRTNNKHDAKSRLRKSLRDAAITSHPRKNSFIGNVYVIINGGSFSATGMVCSCLKRKNRAIFIGQETGGSASILSSDSKHIILPNSEISIEIPTLQYVMGEYPERKNGGIKPDVLLTPTVASIIEGKDIEVIKIKELIKEQLTTIKL